MGYVRTLLQRWRYFTNGAAGIVAILLAYSTCDAQVAPVSQQSEMPWAQELNKYPGLLPEFGVLVAKLQRNIQFPAARAESRLLPLLPESTMSYAAFANYGDVAQHTLQVFRQELQESAVLRDWWEHGAPAATGPKLEDALEKFAQLSQYLGEEVVVSGAVEGREPSLLIVAEVRKPGLKKLLQQMVLELAGKSQPTVRVLDPQELAAAQDKSPSQDLVVLVRPDFLVAALDLATLRRLNARLNRSSSEFVSTPFGQRIAKEYHGGVTALAAADLGQILKQVPPGNQQDQANFQRSGFADMKYLVWEHRSLSDEAVSQAELSFNGPRHGAASWLAKPEPLGSLDFVSPKAMLAATVVLASPARIFDDAKEMAGSSPTSPFATLAALEQMLQLSLKDDLLSHLGGEITAELDSVAAPAPVWKAILGVNDAARVQQTLSKLLAAGHMEEQISEERGLTSYTVRIPSGKTPLEIAYAFADGYLIVGSGRDVVAEGIGLHGSGGSLAKSERFLAALPPGHSLESSGLLYQDPVAMAALRLRQTAPEMAASLAQLTGKNTPTVIGAYGEETAIREASRGGGFDVAAVLVVAAIAIPNLLRSRIAANEASAVGSLRSVNTAQVTYAGEYPQRGYAPNLSTLGPDPRAANTESPAHAALLDDTLGNATCSGNAWCTKSGYHFRVTANCRVQSCKEYVVEAIPVDGNTGVRSFCSTSDGVIRFKIGGPPSAISATQCRAWPPLQ